jgi:hypothetical protein
LNIDPSNLPLGNVQVPVKLTWATFSTVKMQSTVPASIAGAIIAKGFEYRKKGTSAWTSVLAPGAFEVTIDSSEMINTNYEYRAFVETDCGKIYSEIKEVFLECGNCQ